MTGKQWAGIAATGVLAISIYLLPQSVVENKSESLSATSPTPAAVSAGQMPAPADASAQATEDDHEHFEGDGHDHGAEGAEHKHAGNRREIPPLVQQHLESLKESAAKAEDKEKFAIFADSLAANWSRWAWHDSAAHWAEKAVVARPNTQRRYTAGNMWYEAIPLAPDAQQQRTYGERAASHLEKVLEAEPKRTDAQIRLAMTYVVSQNPMKGIMLLREVLEREPKNTEAIFQMGALSFQSNQYDKAIQRFKDLVALEPAHKEGHFYLALSYIQLGENAKAREHLLVVQRLEKSPEVKAVVDDYLSRLK